MYVTVLAREIPRSRPPNVTGLSSSPNFYTPRVLGGDLLLLLIVNRVNQTRRPFCTGPCDSGIPTVAELVDSADETLFKRIIYNSNRVLYQLLPQPSTTVHNLRPTRHDRTLQGKQTRLYNGNFIIRILFEDCYLIPPPHFFLLSCVLLTLY